MPITGRIGASGSNALEDDARQDSTALVGLAKSRDALDVEVSHHDATCLRQGAVKLVILVAGKRTTLRFTDRHAVDLQFALAVAGDKRS